MEELQGMIPANLLRAEVKVQLIDWIRDQRLPRRFKRKLLQDWAEAVGVKLTGEDYAKVERG